MTQKTPKTGAAVIKVGQSELAQALRCSVRTVRQYQTDGVIPDRLRDARGHYDLMGCVGVVIEHLRQAAMGRSVQAGDDGEVLNPSAEAAKLNRSKRELCDLQQIKTRAQIATAEAELALIRGRTLDVESVLAAWGLILTTAKGRLRSIPSSMAHTLGLTRKGIADLSDAIDTALTNLAEDGDAVHADVADRQRIAQQAVHKPTTATLKDDQ